MRDWALILYRIPPEPSALRVSAWRRLKRLGALLLHDAVWVLPASPRTNERLQWLAAEIAEMGGEAMVWEARLADARQEFDLVRRFTEPVEASYREILAELNRKAPDLRGLARRFQHVQDRDHFRVQLGAQVRRALEAAGGGKDA